MPTYRDQMWRIGEEEAIALAKSEWWLRVDQRTIAEFQVFTERLCCPMGVFHEAVNSVAGPGIFTASLSIAHEAIAKIIRRGEPAPSPAELVALIPEDIRKEIFDGKELGSNESTPRRAD